MKYLEEKGIHRRHAEINRLKLGCAGIRKTTGQHPGGLIIVPEGRDINEFTPVQRPANDQESKITTTHFDYHSAIEGRLMKLDILGHDVPTIIRMLQDETGIDPLAINLGDQDVLSLFTSPEPLGVSLDSINCSTGSLGIPEFGTGFVRNMLMDTNPRSFAELVRISGLSHGTDVWLNNAQDIIRDGVASLKEIVPSRDDIMVYLTGMGVDKTEAFKIMENVRKPNTILTEEQADVMAEAGVPEWYIESCRRIKYLFPKGHAVAYVMMSVRIGYFKIHHPLSFYAASFSVKAEEFDYNIMCAGPDVAKDAYDRFMSMGKDATATDKNTLVLLELVLEMYARGFGFLPLDLYESEVSRFRVRENSLLPPLCTVAGLGVSAAKSIAKARKKGKFVTIEDFSERTKTNRAVTELLKQHGALAGMPETNQITLF